MQHIVDHAFVYYAKLSAVGWQRTFGSGSAVASIWPTSVISGKGRCSTVYGEIKFKVKGVVGRLDRIIIVIVIYINIVVINGIHGILY